jgi:hypothetical protein
MQWRVKKVVCWKTFYRRLIGIGFRSSPICDLFRDCSLKRVGSLPKFLFLLVVVAVAPTQKLEFVCIGTKVDCRTDAIHNLGWFPCPEAVPPPAGKNLVFY